MSDPLEHRKKLSFEQAEGVAPLPSQLKRGEISQEFRALLWSILKGELEPDHSAYGIEFLPEPWLTILRDAHLLRDHQINDLPKRHDEIVREVQTKIARAPWSEVLGWVEWVLKHRLCRQTFRIKVNDAMDHCRLAYRVFDGVVICPVASDTEQQALERAFADLAATEFHGARAHLRKAAEQLTAGHYADSVRASIHAVEATVRTLEPSAVLRKALGRLEGSTKIHPALKAGFGSLYRYTSDEQGIRHPLLDDPAASVGETDALFMIGACAAFVSYLINKARTAGLI